MLQKKVFEPGGIQKKSKGVGCCRYVPRIILSLKLQHILLTNHKFGFHECSHMKNLWETYKGWKEFGRAPETSVHW